MTRWVAIAVLCAGCTTYRDALARSQDALQNNEYEQTLGLLRALEPDARHWLAIARAHDDASPGTLPVDWRPRTNDALGELDAVVYSEGYAGLAAKR